MGTAKGFATIMGAKKEAAFKTALAPTDKIPFLSEGIKWNYEDKIYEYLQGSAGIPGQDRIFEPSGGSLETEVIYTQKTDATNFVSVGLLIAMAMGDGGTFAGGANQHLLTDSLSSFFTLAWNKQINAAKVWEAVSCFINTMTITGEANGSVKATFEIIAYDLLTDGSVTTIANLEALPTTTPSPVLFNQMIFQIATHGAEPGASDQYGLKGFTLTLNNNLTPPEQLTLDATKTLDYAHTDAKQPIKPERNGHREVTLEIGLGRYSDDDFFDWWSGDTPLQAYFLGTHPSSSEEFDICIPNMKIIDMSAPVSGPEALEQTVTFRLFTEASTSDIQFSDNSTDVTSEFGIETDDERTAVIWS
ncbi:hypothetical protein LCGC14_2220880 [marine sediment metagenome]|uniref:Uncharacterized protein n=1 Tax=marine sediment metagenome TaxID=412755 RepID=A0A0F9FNJ9_9ZZZZ